MVVAANVYSHAHDDACDNNDDDTCGDEMVMAAVEVAAVIAAPDCYSLAPCWLPLQVAC